MRTIKKILFVILYAFFLFFVLELGVRISGYSSHYIYDPIYMPFADQGNQKQFYVHKPDLVNARGRGLAFFNTDSLGLRSKVSGERYGPKKNNERRIAIVGDSITFGEGVRKTEDTYCSVLEDILGRRQSDVKIRVFNYGVSAYNVKNMVDTLNYRMLKIEPDLVVMAIVSHDFDLSRTGTVDKWGYTDNVKLSGSALENTPLKRVLRKVHLVYVFRDLRHFFVSRNKKVSDDLDNVFHGSYQYTKQFKEIAEQRKIPYLVVLLPPSPNPIRQSIISKFKSDKINYLDLSSIRDEFAPEKFRASRFDPHPSVAVHKRIAEALAVDLALEVNSGKDIFRRWE